MSGKIYDVSELNNRIKSLIESDAELSDVYVRGELSNYKVYPSGHHYFTMKDAEGALRCVMFKSSAVKLRFRPENGMKVIAFGRISVFPRDGAYQLYCSEITPDGIGDLHVAFEQLKDRLYKEGLFAAEHKKALPRYPEKIAVITSSAGAAVKDIIRVLGKRYPFAKVIVLPVRVQGVEAPPEIVGAIKYANRYNVADLMIVGRGGGSIEDLWAFNDERVARAIYDSSIPIISAVGHEPDVTISDFVADLRAATPSNGAELAVPDISEIREFIKTLEIRSDKAIKRKIDENRGKLSDLSGRRSMQSPMNYIEDKRILLDYTRDRLISAQKTRISVERQNYVRFASALDAMSPLKVLGRGYSIVTDGGGQVVKSAKQLKRGDKVNIRFKDDSVDCIVD